MQVSAFCVMHRKSERKEVVSGKELMETPSRIELLHFEGIANYFTIEKHCKSGKNGLSVVRRLT